MLTFGQAVDANVLVYERMREELKLGHDMKAATRVGFSKALPAIVDANVSHLIICFVLYNLGTQEIRGFAIALAVGVLATLFSALVISRTCVQAAGGCRALADSQSRARFDAADGDPRVAAGP